MRRNNLFIFLLFSLMGIYFLFNNPATSIVLLLLSLYFLYGWRDQRGDRFSTKAYLALFYILIIGGIFSFYTKGVLSISLGLLSLLFALSTWLSYRQLKVDEREGDGE
jgi:hypothetical protein